MFWTFSGWKKRIYFCPDKLEFPARLWYSNWTVLLSFSLMKLQDYIWQALQRFSLENIHWEWIEAEPVWNPPVLSARSECKRDILFHISSSLASSHGTSWRRFFFFSLWENLYFPIFQPTGMTGSPHTAVLVAAHSHCWPEHDVDCSVFASCFFWEDKVLPAGCKICWGSRCYIKTVVPGKVTAASATKRHTFTFKGSPVAAIIIMRWAEKEVRCRALQQGRSLFTFPSAVNVISFLIAQQWSFLNSNQVFIIITMVIIVHIKESFEPKPHCFPKPNVVIFVRKPVQTFIVVLSHCKTVLFFSAVV